MSSPRRCRCTSIARHSRVPIRLRFTRFCGTSRPSCLHSRFISRAPTDQRPFRSQSVTERRPRRGFATASSLILATKLSRYGFGGAVRRRRAVLGTPPVQRHLGNTQGPRSCGGWSIVPCPGGGLRRLRSRSAAEGALCRGIFMVSCIVPLSPRRVSQEIVQRTIN